MNMETKLSGLEVGYDVPALPGMSVDEIQTPCLILDLDALERNIRKMGDYAKAHGMRHRAHGKMHKSVDVLRLQQEPIAITAAMIGSYVDLYRVKLGASKRKNYSAVHKDFGYKGSDYRLKRSAETASHYTLKQIENCMQVLLELDQSLKGQPVDAQILLETALCRLAMAGSGR